MSGNEAFSVMRPGDMDCRGGECAPRNEKIVAMIAVTIDQFILPLSHAGPAAGDASGDIDDLMI